MNRYTFLINYRYVECILFIIMDKEILKKFAVVA